MMIAILIFIISILTLLEFFVSFCHSLIAESRDYQLSEWTREISSITAKGTQGDKFERVLQLIALCPEWGSDRIQVLAVSIYFSMLGLVRSLSSWAAPAAAPWIESERGGCAYVIAVMLDRRIACNRDLMAQQMSNGF
jgi:hypothetical protein